MALIACSWRPPHRNVTSRLQMSSPSIITTASQGKTYGCYALHSECVLPLPNESLHVWDRQWEIKL